MSFDRKAQSDLTEIVSFIEKHEKSRDIYSIFSKGPEPGCGFMWTPTEWWTPEQAKALKIISNKVLDLGWDSSGYGMMMRMIQDKMQARVTVENPEEDLLAGDEGKYEGDLSTGKGSSLYDHKYEDEGEYTGDSHNNYHQNQTDNGEGVAKLYQQTSFAKNMDEANKKALNVWATEGTGAAIKHMFTDQETGNQLSYAEMRSRFG